ncbi:efflux RND transporter periplasmic adaptor subunit [Rhodobacteraceae bacterium B1Z28]|uniref:Efflux RND transporter periplasmic adaptor subunit n=1 Tax=Ruegeria haliotis TaxID=2747601 RepID=A0ABX2PXP9_9RHOB|nr:efflux RND transporter periplasmic adaptor subunit [Ruegeria haliotis]NVO57784.1 efflux RND transporter periplasmic adaptor subunit [Ruegeria haliotis]
MADKSAKSPPKPLRRWLWICLAFLLLIAVVVLLFSAEDTVDVQTSQSPLLPPKVSVITVTAKSARAQISSFAEVQPRWDAELRSAISGRITTVHDAALAGAQVSRGDPLFSIEKAPYESAVADAQMGLEQARLTLLRAQNDVTVARRQFERDRVDPPNDLALRLPQLGIAEKTVEAAQSRLNAAQSELSDTDVTAPFSGFVTRRFASLGQTVTPGEALVHLSDDQQFELVAEFSQADWALLDHPISGAFATLIHRSDEPLGQARVRRGGGFLDQDTRQVRVFLEIAEPDDRILAGDFLQVQIAGRTIADTLTLPESTLTRAGYIWLINIGDRLQRVTPEILFRNDGTITISAPEGTGPWRVAKTPLASFLPGQRVTPQSDEG